MEQPLNPWDPSKTVRATRWMLLLIYSMCLGVVVVSIYRLFDGESDQWVGIIISVVTWLIVQYAFVKGKEHPYKLLRTIGALRIVRMCGVLMLVHRSAMEHADDSKGFKE